MVPSPFASQSRKRISSRSSSSFGISGSGLLAAEVDFRSISER